jgi:hypothetical protein
MTKPDRAAQFWSLLVFAAHTQNILSYDLIERLTGIPRRAVGDFLGPIQEYCKRNDLPPLTSLVVSEKTGLPSEGFTEATDIVGAQARTFVYDWLGRKAPSPGDFRF